MDFSTNSESKKLLCDKQLAAGSASTGLFIVIMGCLSTFRADVFDDVVPKHPNEIIDDGL